MLLKYIDQRIVVSDFEEIAEVSGDVTTYLDEDVINSTTYYYYVTAIYPDVVWSQDQQELLPPLLSSGLSFGWMMVRLYRAKWIP